MKPGFGRVAVFAVAATLWLGLASRVQADFVFEGNSGTHAASVTFSISADTLTVTLANTSMNDVLVPTDVLTAIFFDAIPPDIQLARRSAVLGSGSIVLFGPAPSGVVGGEWAYKSGLGGTPGLAGFGVSSSGLNLFGPTDRFPGANLQGPVSINGLQYGITSAGDNPLTGNAAVTGNYALIKNSVVFTMGLPEGVTISNIGNVWFQYGTALTDGSYSGTPVAGTPQTPVPEAPTLIAGLLLLLPFGASALRIVRSKAKISVNK